MTEATTAQRAGLSGSAGWLVVFAKVPRPGAVKTRMCPPLDWETAARLYEAMLSDVLAESERAADHSRLELVIAVESSDGAALLSRRGPSSARFVEQVGESLAQRMIHIAHSARAAGAATLVIRGSDSPALGADVIGEAARRVAARKGGGRGLTEVALSPDPDGGYNLVALSSDALREGFLPGIDLFDHPMSHPRVLEATRARVEAAGLRWELLDESFDIDCAADLERLRPWRERGRDTPCSATLAFVEQHALWPGARPRAGSRLDSANSAGNV